MQESRSRSVETTPHGQRKTAERDGRRWGRTGPAGRAPRRDTVPQSVTGGARGGHSARGGCGNAEQVGIRLGGGVRSPVDRRPAIRCVRFGRRLSDGHRLPLSVWADVAGSTGIAALLNGTTDICASSRMMRDKERTLASQRQITPTEITVGMDGLAVMVNSQNPVDSLTLDQLRRIFVGELTNWSGYGGPDQPITILSRESNSGTHVYFKQNVLNKADFTAEALLMPSTATIVQETQNNQWAIGYGGVAYALNSDVKIIKVKADDESPAVFPADEEVSAGRYPIARPLFLYTNGEPEGLIKKFVDFCLTPEGQKLVKETGYVPIG